MKPGLKKKNRPHVNTLFCLCQLRGSFPSFYEDKWAATRQGERGETDLLLPLPTLHAAAQQPPGSHRNKKKQNKTFSHISFLHKRSCLPAF